ncbi:helix-turn-helix transcriptional regulator [Nocardioides ultimimeridianus]
MPGPASSTAYLEAAKHLGERVYERRTELGWTQEELAEKADLSRNQIQNIEKNRNNTKDPQTGLPGPSNARLDTVFKLAAALDLRVRDLIDPES